MTLRPCLDCGTPSPGSRCSSHETERLARVDRLRGSSTVRGYDSRWRRLSERARAAQPFCLDCGSTENLTVHHLRWPATALSHVVVLCQADNNRRGPTPR